MNIGSTLSGFDRFSGFSTSRSQAVANQGAVPMQTGENVNNPAKTGASWNAQDGKGTSADKDGSGKGRFDKNDCETCANRTYQDGSNDPGVSFKTPTKISPEQAATAVMGHEMEHVSRNQSKAQIEGREIISQSVTLQSAICQECGQSFISGGETTTVTGERSAPKEQDNPFQAGIETPSRQKGKNLDAVA